ncbi:hypothetical protein SSS_09722 [Sarcoptes scabiei]|uniref:Uncharacterized protein n=1 Tax=Sarcoptes scabiei TaxID=52283 RepID=A0A834VF33_SARSC|nr:hypothetical protein SSS_09722 [Sarcoptes scabiei]
MNQSITLESNTILDNVDELWTNSLETDSFDNEFIWITNRKNLFSIPKPEVERIDKNLHQNYHRNDESDADNNRNDFDANSVIIENNSIEFVPNRSERERYDCGERKTMIMNDYRMLNLNRDYSQTNQKTTPLVEDEKLFLETIRLEKMIFLQIFKLIAIYYRSLCDRQNNRKKFIYKLNDSRIMEQNRDDYVKRISSEYPDSLPPQPSPPSPLPNLPLFDSDRNKNQYVWIPSRFVVNNLERKYCKEFEMKYEFLMEFLSKTYPTNMKKAKSLNVKIDSIDSSIDRFSMGRKLSQESFHRDLIDWKSLLDPTAIDLEQNNSITTIDCDNSLKETQDSQEFVPVYTEIQAIGQLTQWLKISIRQAKLNETLKSFSSVEFVRRTSKTIRSETNQAFLSEQNGIERFRANDLLGFLKLNDNILELIRCKKLIIDRLIRMEKDMIEDGKYFHKTSFQSIFNQNYWLNWKIFNKKFTASSSSSSSSLEARIQCIQQELDCWQNVSEMILEFQ